MRLLLTIFFAISVTHAANLSIAKDGVSPDKKYAIAVVPQKEGEFIDEADGSVYLVQYPSLKPLQKLDETDSTGGTWGRTTTNIRCKWSPDGHFLGINMRIGRLMHGYILYRIIDSKASLVVLPEAKLHPKGKIYEVLDYTANPGAVITRWLSSSSFTTEEYGLRPKGEGIDFGKYGIPDFDGLIEAVYSLKDGKWRVEDLRSPKNENSG